MAPQNSRRVFPGDLSDFEGHRFLLVGRIVSRSDAEVAVADAFTTVQVEGALAVEEGDLVVLDVERGPSTLVCRGSWTCFGRACPRDRWRQR